jgi:hypothetical protein
MPPLIAVFARGLRMGAANGNTTTAPTPIARPVTQLPLVRAGRLELPRPYGQQILSLPRLPFRHARSSYSGLNLHFGLIPGSGCPRSV